MRAYGFTSDFVGEKYVKSHLIAYLWQEDAIDGQKLRAECSCMQMAYPCGLLSQELIAKHAC